MKSRLLILIVLCAALRMAAQSAATTVYAESFRQGATHVTEESFEAKLTPQDAIYRERIKDSRGVDRYAFSIVPHGPGGRHQDHILASETGGPASPIYDNVLLASQAPSDDPGRPRDSSVAA